MRNKILILGAVAFLAYILGSRATRPQVKRSETIGHQIVRLWNEPKARRSRKKTAKKLAKTGRKKAERAAKAARAKAHNIKKQFA